MPRKNQKNPKVEVEEVKAEPEVKAEAEEVKAESKPKPKPKPKPDPEPEVKPDPEPKPDPKPKAKPDIFAKNDAGDYVYSVKEMEEYIEKSNAVIMEHQHQIELHTEAIKDLAKKQHEVDAIIASRHDDKFKEKVETQRLLDWTNSQNADLESRAAKLEQLKELTKEL